MNGTDMRNIRNTYGMTQTELANAIGVTVGTISRIERGRQQISKRTEHALNVFVMTVETFGEFSTDDILQEMEIAQKAARRVQDYASETEADYWERVEYEEQEGLDDVEA